MNKYKITWSPKAYEDLQRIDNYIRYYLKEENIANKLIKKLFESISNLKYLPEKYPMLKHNDIHKNIRKMPVENYIVIYQIDYTSRTNFYSTYISEHAKLFKIHLILIKFQ